MPATRQTYPVCLVNSSGLWWMDTQTLPRQASPWPGPLGAAVSQNLFLSTQVTVTVAPPEEHRDAILIDTAEVRRLLDGFKGHTKSAIDTITDKTNRDYLINYAANTSKDVLELRNLILELGLKCTATVKSFGNREYIVLKGYGRGLRELLKGNRYKPTNAKILEFGIGKAGLMKSAVKGTTAGIVIVSIIDIGEAIIGSVLYDKEFLWQELALTLEVDFIKTVVAGALALAVGIGVAALTSFVWAPAAAGLLVAFGVSVVLDWFFPTEEIVAGITRWCDTQGRKAEQFLERAGQRLSESAVNLRNEFHREASQLRRAYSEAEWNFLLRVYHPH